VSQTNSTAVLLLAHGTPDVLGEMAEYLAKVTGGRTLPPEVVEELQHRYAQIGLRETPGPEAPPLTKWTLTQTYLLEQAIAAAGHPLRVYTGMRNWHPYIADVVAKMRTDGVTRIIAICLAPQNSRTSTGLYRRAALTEAVGIIVDFIDGWAHEPLLAQAFAARLRVAIAQVKSESDDPIHVLFTAHSVPCRTIQAAAASAGQPILWPSGRPGASGTAESTPDPYPVEAKFTAQAVAALVPEVTNWYFAFQSQGASGGPWIGPSVESTLDALAQQGVRNLILQPIGFLCDHVEILYDIDIAFHDYAAKLGIRLSRPESLNDSPILTQALVQLSREAFVRLDTELPVTPGEVS